MFEKKDEHYHLWLDDKLMIIDNQYWWLFVKGLKKLSMNSV